MRRVLLPITIALFALAAIAAEAQHENVVITVKGMHCEGCARGITAMLKRTAGVVAATVSFEKREAHVTYDKAVTTPGKIIEAITRLGYEATVKG